MSKRKETKIDLNEVSEQFSKVRTKYDTLGINLAQALELFLKESDIKVLSVSYRVKDKDSFVEKIDRKNYEKPFDEIEDICGIRIICYYQSDVDKIAKIISEEFDVLENQDKEELLEADQFGYRSTHFIVKIKKGWLQAPNYRGLENLKTEIQIRTVLMHAWAEIEHKLAYKKKSHIPDKFIRKLSRISAKLEEADEQFEELRNAVESYKQDIVETVQHKSHDTKNIELNLDSLQAFLDATFPDRDKDIAKTVKLIDEFLTFQIGMQEFISSYEQIKNYLAEIEKDIREISGIATLQWTQVGMARMIMSVTNERYSKSQNKGLSPKYIELDNKWREVIKKDQAKEKSSENN
jgi:ppGpp synthetase/RelA/SpoT-type nucleotidyltranferase